MPSVRINKEINQGIYFLTLTVKRWYYLFDRHHRWDILLDSLRYCQKNKGLKIYHWVYSSANKDECLLVLDSVYG
ncbi:MAG: hypothetical protein NUV74_00565 [Candidatus Brocadiaceae bacterium]|nr:hypothetical protein [Candidatus Brocadiaceae bacterium]